MNNRYLFTVGGGCLALVVLLVVAVVAIFATFGELGQASYANWTGANAESVAVAPPTFTPAAPRAAVAPGTPAAPAAPSLPVGPADSLTGLYEQLNPGVVNIQVYIQRQAMSGQGAGSGFVLDEQGHIVTNNHVVADATTVTVVFFNSLEEDAQVVGTDPASDLAVLRVEQLPEGTHPLPLADSDQVRVGEWVVAIGNPFELGGSMSVGIVSAIGRTIPSGATPFSIPQAIQTDAAINPGNSGGPLLNLRGEVIGVNAQILTRGQPANAGVGFAIPANVVRRVAPALIENGRYDWPWLGAQGGDVNLAIMEANKLESQQGAYIDAVVPNSPADKAGLRGSSKTDRVGQLDVPVGGDVVIAADGNEVVDFADLLDDIAAKAPGDQMTLSIIRDGRRQDVTVTLAPRPEDFGSNSTDFGP